jgi:hypothetical protein
MSQISLTLRGYRQEMLIQTILSASVIVTTSLFLVKKSPSSHWWTLIASILILAYISNALCSIFYYTQFNLLFGNFPSPPSSQVVNEAQKLLTSYDVFTEVYLCAYTTIFLVLAGLLWQTSSRID